MTVVEGGRCRALLPVNSLPVEVMVYAGRHWQHRGTESEEREWGHAETLGSEFIACHNFISVAVTNYPTTKQLKGEEFIWNMIPGCS